MSAPLHVARYRGRFILQHAVFWLISIVLFTVVLFFTRGDFTFAGITLGFAVNILVTIVLLAVSVYINLWWLIPAFFNRRRYGVFAVLQVANILLFIFLNYYVSYFMEGMSHSENLLAEFIAEFILVLIFLVVSTLLKFMRDSIALHDIELKIRDMERERVETELRALKAQVNPHFFFNTLNSLYALSLDKSERAPELILRLSDLMRYVIYEAGDDLVPVGKQLEFLQNYVFLERVRTDDLLPVSFDVEGAHREVRIAPLVFLAFVENAFKHGEKDPAGDPFIRIRFDLRKPDRVGFFIENRMDLRRPVASGGGFGLANVRRQLELRYPGRHEMSIGESEGVFRVELTIFAL